MAVGVSVGVSVWVNVRVGVSVWHETLLAHTAFGTGVPVAQLLTTAARHCGPKLPDP